MLCVCCIPSSDIRFGSVSIIIEIIYNTLKNTSVLYPDIQVFYLLFGTKTKGTFLSRLVGTAYESR